MTNDSLFYTEGGGPTWANLSPRTRPDMQWSGIINGLTERPSEPGSRETDLFLGYFLSSKTAFSLLVSVFVFFLVFVFGVVLIVVSRRGLPTPP